jgi:tetratricopeptide (TPR) repeat protein
MKPMLRAAACTVALISLSGCESFVSALGFGPKDAPKRAEAAMPFGSTELERGRIALKAGYPGNAIQQFRMAALNPDTAGDAYNGLGVAYAKLGRAELAERYFKMALSVDGNNPRYAANLSRFYNSPLGNSARALAMREKEAVVQMEELAGIAEEQGLIEAAPQQAERRGAVTLERPAVRVVRSSNRELRLASIPENVEVIGGNDLQVAASTSSKTSPEGRQQTIRTQENLQLSMLQRQAKVQSYPVRINVVGSDRVQATRPARPSYPIRIRLRSSDTAE